MPKRKLIVYFSYTGTTKSIVDKIHEKLKCDILELQPEEAYSSDYEKVVNDEKKNSKNSVLPKVKSINLTLKNYDEIILASPVWWYHLAPVIRTFLRENDLSGITIIPLVTSVGWFGMVMEDLKMLCPDSEIKTPCFITFDSNRENKKLVTHKSAINKWFKELTK